MFRLVPVLAALAVAAALPASATGESAAIAYKLHCTGCHLDSGAGNPEVGRIPPFPGLAGHFLKHPKGRLFLSKVPGMVNAGLPADETAAVLNYVLEHYGAKDTPEHWEPFTKEEVERNWSTKVDDISALRGEISADLAKQGIDLRY